MNNTKKTQMFSKLQIADWFQSLQDQICQEIELTDGDGKFQEDLWERDGGGGGRTRAFSGGKIIEKGGVNFSAVEGTLSAQAAKALKINTDQTEFFACGVSIVLHPVNPMVPIIHMNVRYFELDDDHYWFGGGIDLTPHYIDQKDAQWFHEQLKEVCDQAHPEYYAWFKEWADDYFFLKHRNETRGVGGIFFDRLNEDSSKGLTKGEIWQFVQGVGEIFAPTYTSLMKKNHTLPFTPKNKEWQSLRRGRYVEFNLVWDRGTKFGLETNGRTESILMSMPPQAEWVYNFEVEKDSEEEKTLNLLKKGIQWI